MRILVVGAGATGGYFGGRLLAAGRHVTFLVRPERAARLAADGLRIRSGFGDLDLPAPPTVLAGALKDPFDLVLLSCKTYDLDGAMDAFAPALGPGTVVLPMLNGMAHFDVLDRRCGPGRVLGGLCLISSVQDPEGRILHRNRMHGLVSGDRGGVGADRVAAVDAALGGAGFDSRRQRRNRPGAVGEVGVHRRHRRAHLPHARHRGDGWPPGATAFAAALLGRVRSGGCRPGFLGPGRGPGAHARHSHRPRVGGGGRSMLDDLERGRRLEAGPIIGDLLRRGRERGGAWPLLELVHLHLQTFEVRRGRAVPWEPDSVKVRVPPSRAGSVGCGSLRGVRGRRGRRDSPG